MKSNLVSNLNSLAPNHFDIMVLSQNLICCFPKVPRSPLLNLKGWKIQILPKFQNLLSHTSSFIAIVGWLLHGINILSLWILHIKFITHMNNRKLLIYTIHSYLCNTFFSNLLCAWKVWRSLKINVYSK